MKKDEKKLTTSDKISIASIVAPILMWLIDKFW